MTEGLPILTERLVLNEFTEADAPFLNQLMNSPEYIRYIGDRNIDSDEKAAVYIKSKLMPSYSRFGYGFYIVRLRHMDFPIGLCGITKRDHLQYTDLGFAFLKEYMGMGYALESCRSIMDHAIEYCQIDKLIAVTTDENEQSKKLLLKLGFQFGKKVKWDETEEIFQYVIDL